ncbi:helix-turn-helix domain-containing protein [Flavobacterium plurextorum]|uniref:helix-turn-helix domain-containing protein n=1 Tax=Flavobacterium TaxID=237 RepID=UPI00214D4EA9|nr:MULTISPECIES: helix-turn-helix domain-containing protein [Flavobacterium]UUW08455.1 helix-turn-helix domain-containing protein [Flavobacterium plurextorum]
MESFKFEDLPNLIGELFVKIENIEKLLQENILHSTTVVEDELLTVSEAAKLLKLSVATVYTKVCRNEIPANKQGKRLYFYRKELLEWIKSGRIRTISEIKKDVETNSNFKQLGR